MTRALFFYYLKRFGPEMGLFLIYFIIGRIEISIHPIDTFATLLWLPAGITLAAILLYGYRLWPAIMLAAFAVYFSIGAGFVASLGIALGSTLEATAGAYFLKRYIGFSPTILRLRDNVGLIIVALCAPTIHATISTASLWLAGSIPIGGELSIWSAWWIGDTLSILIIAPLIFKWLHEPLFQKIQITPAQYLELCAVVIVIFFTSVFIFWMPQGHFAYYLFIPLTWAALRTGPRGITLTMFVAASAAISGTLAGEGAYTNQDLLSLQIFIGTMGALFLIFTAIVEERKKTQVTLGLHVSELEQALHRASSEDTAKKDFLAILAHELRNPLSAILSSVELLRLQEVHTPDTSALLQTIDEHVRAMTTMLEDLLDVSRISRNKLTLRKERLSLDSLVDRSVRASQALIRSHGHTLSIVKSEHELFLDADPIRLEQILVNLLNNAAKYTNPNGLIELITQQEGTSAVIRIRDSGIGISRNMLKLIFEPFFQVERGKLPTEGLGVGLPLTRQLVEMHQGSIEALSRGKGQGSEFVVRLPLSTKRPEPSVPKSKTSSNKVPQRTKHARTVLVVDDNEPAAESLGRLLELRGHEVAIAHNGTEAIDKARQLHPQIIILDIGLPDIDGYEVARIVQGEKNYSPILIALTGYGQPGDKELALTVGFNLHLTKPVSLKEIEAAFRKVSKTSA